MKKIFAALIVFCLVFTLTSCKNSDKDPTKQIIYYNLDSEPVTLDPQIAHDNSSRLIIFNLYEGLMRLDSNKQLSFGVAEEYIVSEDGLKYTFTLRDDAKWTDGADVTAHDFVFAFQRALSKATASPSAYLLYPVKNAEAVHRGDKKPDDLGIKATDDYTLEIILEYKSETFLTVLTCPVAMPCNKVFFEQTQGQYGCESEYVLSNGPFMLRKNYGWLHDEYLSLRNNPDYSGIHNAIPAGVDLSINKSFNNILDAMDKNELDAAFLPSQYINQAKLKNYNLTTFSDTVWSLSFNLNDTALKNQNIRESLLCAIDRKELLKKVPENCSVTNDLIDDSAQLDGQNYRSFAGKGLYFKQDKNARKLLENGLKAIKEDKLPSITILCIDEPEAQEIATGLIEMWNSKLGVYFNKKTLSRYELTQSLSTGDFQIAIAPVQSQGSSPVNFIEQFVSKNELNFVSLNNSDYDVLVEAAKSKKGTAALNDILAAEKLLNDSGILYPLYVENRYYAAKETVKDIVFYEYDGIADFINAKKVLK